MTAALIAIWAITPGALLIVPRLWRERRRLPAAPDDLLTCRRINDLPLAPRKENPKP